jgi:hypothetical protein
LSKEKGYVMLQLNLNQDLKYEVENGGGIIKKDETLFIYPSEKTEGRILNFKIFSVYK